MATVKRIYLVTELVKDTDAPNAKPVYHLVNAASQSAAIKHVTSTRFEIETAKPHKIAELIGAGVQLEQAGD